MYSITHTFLYVNRKIKNIRICFQSGSDAALFPDAGPGLAWATVQEIDRFIVVGDWDAVVRAINTTDTDRRNTALAERINELIKE